MTAGRLLVVLVALVALVGCSSTSTAPPGVAGEGMPAPAVPLELGEWQTFANGARARVTASYGPALTDWYSPSDVDPPDRSIRLAVELDNATGAVIDRPPMVLVEFADLAGELSEMPTGADSDFPARISPGRTVTKTVSYSPYNGQGSPGAWPFDWPRDASVLVTVREPYTEGTAGPTLTADEYRRWTGVPA